MPEARVPLAEIPIDSLVRVERDGANIVAIRTSEGIFAYYDRCPHAYWPLSQGAVTNGVLECPGHGWEFDVETGRCLNAPAYCLSPVAAKQTGESVHLEWNAVPAEGTPLRSKHAGDLPASS